MNPWVPGKRDKILGSQTYNFDDKIFCSKLELYFVHGKFALFADKR